MDQIRVNGIEEAERVLDEMIRNYPKQTVAAGLRAAAKPFVNRTKEAGPSPKFSNGCRAIRRQNETGVEDTQQLYVNVLYLLLVESWDIVEPECCLSF